jgi:hypothetical protein
MVSVSGRPGKFVECDEPLLALKRNFRGNLAIITGADKA